jgi:hypothetical protein
MENVQNPGSAIGEAIGAQMEIALNTYLTELVSKYSCRLISRGQENPKTGKATKLLLYDNYGTAYNIDSVITNESMQPIVLVEYKYIRYKKHNRDKGSWLCTAHTAIRRRYNSVRSSIAILAGSWSGSSVAMMKSQDINIFIIPFDKITQLLKKHKIKFDWGEKDRHIANKSWTSYSALSKKQKLKIAEEMIAVIKPDLEAAIEKTLDNKAKRKVEKVTIEIHTNIGEVKRFEFPDTQSALDFLEDFSFDEMLNNADSFTLFDKPTVDPDEGDEEPTEM